MLRKGDGIIGYGRRQRIDRELRQLVLVKRDRRLPFLRSGPLVRANERNRRFHAAIPSAVEAEDILDVIAGDRLILLNGVPILRFRFPVAVLRIRLADFMHDIVTVRRHRQIGDGCVPHRLGEVRRVIPAVLKERTLVDQFPSAAFAHQSKLVILLRCLRLRGCAFCQSERLKVCRVITRGGFRYDFAHWLLRRLEIRRSRYSEHSGKIGNMIELPTVVIAGQLNRIRFKAIEYTLDVGAVGPIPYPIGLTEQPVFMNTVARADDERRRER